MKPFEGSTWNDIVTRVLNHYAAYCHGPIGFKYINHTNSSYIVGRMTYDPRRTQPFLPCGID